MLSRPTQLCWIPTLSTVLPATLHLCYSPNVPCFPGGLADCWGTPSAVNNGVYSDSACTAADGGPSPFPAGSVCTVTCNAGFYPSSLNGSSFLQGPLTATCSNNGQWVKSGTCGQRECHGTACVHSQLRGCQGGRKKALNGIAHLAAVLTYEMSHVATSLSAAVTGCGAIGYS